MTDTPTRKEINNENNKINSLDGLNFSSGKKAGSNALSA